MSRVAPTSGSKILYFLCITISGFLIYTDLKYKSFEGIKFFYQSLSISSSYIIKNITIEPLKYLYKISKDKFEIDGGATIREINKATGWSLPTDGPKTLNGLVLEQLENIPDGNISFLIDNYCFETANIEGAMVKKVSVSKLPNPSKKP